MKNLSQYRLTDLSELQPFKEKMGEREFYKLAFAIYKRLFTMRPGESYNILKKVVPENQEVFIKIACCYIIDHQTPHQFNETFTIIKKI